MQEIRRKGLLTGVLTFLVLQLLIYYSDFNFIYDKLFYTITILSIIGYCAFIFLHFKNKKRQIFLFIITLVFSFYLLITEFITSFNGTEKVLEIWDIDNYEIVCVTEEYYAGKGSAPYLKLKQKYFLGILIIDLDEIKADYNHLEIGKTKCLVEFNSEKVIFDLCNKKKIKSIDTK